MLVCTSVSPSRRLICKHFFVSGVVERHPAPRGGFRGECCQPTALHRLCGQWNDKMSTCWPLMSTCWRCWPFVNRMRKRKHNELREVWCWRAIMRDVCHAVVNRTTRWRRYPVNSDGQAASRKEQWTRSPECLAGAGYLELRRHCVTQLQVRPVGVRTEAMLPNGSVICTRWLLWIMCRLSCGRGSDAVRGMFVDCGRATWCETGPFADRWSGLTV